MIKPCRKCGSIERYTSGRCAPCFRVSKSKWKAENPEKVKALSAKWYAKNHEKAKAINAKWKAENPEKVKAYSAKRRAENPEKARRFVNASQNKKKLEMQMTEFRAQVNEMIEETNGH